MPAKPGSRKVIYSEEPFKGASPHKSVDPHSEWQLMIEKARERYGLSLRALAELAEVPAGNLFNWLRSAKGHPPRASYTTSLNERLAKALKMKPDALADAYNKSAFKPVDPKNPDPAPRAPRPGIPRSSPALQESATAYKVDGLKRFISTLKATGRESFTMLELEQFSALLLPPE